MPGPSGTGSFLTIDYRGYSEVVCRLAESKLAYLTNFHFQSHVENGMRVSNESLDDLFIDNSVF